MECQKCGLLIAHNHLARHQRTLKCQLEASRYQLDKANAELIHLQKKVKKYKKYKQLYNELIKNGIGNTINTTIHNNIDKSTKTTTNQYLSLQGYTLEALKDKMVNFPVLNYGNGRKASEQVARFVAENVRGENDELTVICTDQERQKFYCLEDDKWIEDVSKQKTVGGVCQCIKDHFGDEKTFINKLVEKRKQELQDETARMLQGIENENDLQRDLLNYKSKVTTTVSQIIACSGGGENDFSKGYLKKLSSLVRGTKTQRKAVKQMLQ